MNFWSVFGFDANQSTISGVASGDALIINQTYTLTVQAKDSSGNNIAASGEDLYVYISDLCTRGPNMSCVPSSFTQSAVNGGEVIHKMTDSGGGTYTASFDLNHIGEATISVIQVETVGVQGEYFNSGDISGTPDITNTSSDITFSWPGDITPGYTEAAGRFTSKITTFQSGTYQVSLFQDDGATLNLNNVEKASNYGAYMNDYTNFTYTFNAFETYDLEILWKDNGFGAVLTLSWDSGSGNNYIPSQNYAVAHDISQSPLQISISCPDKYEQVPSTTDQCRTICGDGFVFGSEVCDDGNSADGDGCKGDCTAVESNWACSGGSATSSSACTECTQGFYQNDHLNPISCVTRCGDGLRAGTEACDDGNTNDHDGCSADCLNIESNFVCTGGDSSTQDSCVQCQSGTIPDTNQASCISVCGDGIVANTEACDDGNTQDSDGCSSDCTTVESGWKCDDLSPSACSRNYNSIPLSSSEKATQGSILGITGGAVIFNAASSFFSKSSPGGAFAAVNQIQLLLLLLLLDIYLPLKVINYLRSLCSALVNFDIDWKFFIMFRKIIEWFDYPQDQDDLYLVNLESGSALLNLNTFVTLILLFIILSSLLYCNRKCKGILTKVTDYIENSLNFGFYVGLIFESFIMLCLCSFSELKRFHILGSSVQQHSFYSSVMFGVFVISVIVFVCWKWNSTKSITEGQMKTFQKEFFGGLKLNRFARLYPVMFLARRAALCLLIIGLEGMDRQVFLCIYLATTSIHCVAILVIRPYQKVSANIQEITNEVFYVGFCAMLVWHYEEHHWNSTKTEIYFWSLLMNNIVNALFSLVVFTITLVKHRAENQKVMAKQRKSIPVEKMNARSQQQSPRKVQVKESCMNDHRPNSIRNHSNKAVTLSKGSNISRQSHLSLREKLSLADVDVLSLHDSGNHMY